MEKCGKRPFYIICSASDYDGVSSRVWRICKNKKEALQFFKYLYNVLVYRDYLNENGDEMFTDRNYTTNEDVYNKERISGDFWYCDDEGTCSYALTTCYTNYALGWNGSCNERTEREFLEYVENNTN